MTSAIKQPKFERVGDLILVLVPILLTGLLLVRNWGSLRHSCEQLTDYVLLSLNVENAKRLQALTGAYSRLELRHPGPILFYLYAIGDWLFSFVPMPLGRFRLAQYAINTGFLCIVAVAGARLFGSRTFGLLTMFATLLACVNSEGTSFGVLAEIWNPYPAILSTTCLILSGALVAQGDNRFWIPTALAFTVTAQTHLGALPVASVVLGLSVTLWALHVRRGTSNGSLVHPLFALAITVITWTPVLFEALSTAQGGNLGAIVRFAASTASEQPFLAVLTLVSKHYSKLVGVDSTALSLGMFFGTYLLLWLPGDLAAPLRHLRLFVTVGCGLSIVSLTKTTGDLFSYLSLYHFGISTVAIMLVVKRLLLALNPSFHRFALFVPRILLFLCFGIFSTQLPYQAPYSLRCLILGPARVLAHSLPRRRQELNHLKIENDRLWHSLATLGLVLARDDRAFCIDRELWYIFDSSLVCKAETSGDTHKRVVTLFPTKAGSAPPGARTVQSGPVSIYWIPKKRAADTDID